MLFLLKYVLIGALAARLQGFPRMTAGADITPANAKDNLQNLARALKDLEAQVYTENTPQGIPFECSASNLEQVQLWNLTTKAGRLDIAFQPAGTDGYDDLMKDAHTYEAYGTKIYAASLEDIIRAKKAADRPQDRQDIIILREILKRDQLDWTAEHRKRNDEFTQKCFLQTKVDFTAHVEGDNLIKSPFQSRLNDEC